MWKNSSYASYEVWEHQFKIFQVGLVEQLTTNNQLLLKLLWSDREEANNVVILAGRQGVRNGHWRSNNSLPTNSQNSTAKFQCAEPLLFQTQRLVSFNFVTKRESFLCWICKYGSILLLCHFLRMVTSYWKNIYCYSGILGLYA